MKSPLEQLEARFRGIFEGKPSIQDWMQDRPDSIRELINQIDVFLKQQSANDPLTDQFVFYFSPADSKTLGCEPELEKMISPGSSNSTEEMIAATGFGAT